MAEKENLSDASSRRVIEWHPLPYTVPDGTKFVRLLAREFRVAGSGTTQREWALMELEVRRVVF